MKPKNLVVQARLDAETSSLFIELSRALEWSDSKIIREALKVLAACTPGVRKRRLFGVGKFSSGCSDLGSNKRHLRGFGR